MTDTSHQSSVAHLSKLKMALYMLDALHPPLIKSVGLGESYDGQLQLTLALNNAYFDTQGYFHDHQPRGNPDGSPGGISADDARMHHYIAQMDKLGVALQDFLEAMGAHADINHKPSADMLRGSNPDEFGLADNTSRLCRVFLSTRYSNERQLQAMSALKDLLVNDLGAEDMARTSPKDILKDDWVSNLQRKQSTPLDAFIHEYAPYLTGVSNVAILTPQGDKIAPHERRNLAFEYPPNSGRQNFTHLESVSRDTHYPSGRVLWMSRSGMAMNGDIDEFARNEGKKLETALHQTFPNLGVSVKVIQPEPGTEAAIRGQIGLMIFIKNGQEPEIKQVLHTIEQSMYLAKQVTEEEEMLKSGKPDKVRIDKPRDTIDMLAARHAMQNAVGVTNQVEVDEGGSIWLALPTQGATPYTAALPYCSHSINPVEIANSKGLAVLMDHGFTAGMDAEAVIEKGNAIQKALRAKLGIPDLYVELMSLHDVEMPREVRQKCSSAVVVVCPPEHQEKLQSEGSAFLQSLLEESRSLKRA